MRAFFLALSLCVSAALPAMAQEAPPSIADTNTVLHPGDEVRITVWRNPELSGDFPIGINGALVHPLYQAVPITGVPMQEVTMRIRNFLKTYQSDPQIVVVPLLHVTVAGEVGKPSLYNFPRGTSIGEAIATAGGPSADGNIGKVSLFRDNREIKIDLRSPLNAWASSPVQSGDAIIVNHRGSFWRDVFVPLLTLTGTVASIVNLVRR
jgi:polysaccharide export outer membrane protein